jgi:hypothetical protein
VDFVQVSEFDTQSTVARTATGTGTGMRDSDTVWQNPLEEQSVMGYPPLLPGTGTGGQMGRNRLNT